MVDRTFEPTECFYANHPILTMSLKHPPFFFGQLAEATSFVLVLPCLFQLLKHLFHDRATHTWRGLEKTFLNYNQCSSPFTIHPFPIPLQTHQTNELIQSIPLHRLFFQTESCHEHSLVARDRRGWSPIALWWVKRIRLQGTYPLLVGYPISNRAPTTTS